MRHNLAIFVSGSGTNCENIIRYFSGRADARVALVVSNRPEAFALVRAERLGVPTAVVKKGAWADADAVLALLREHGVSFIVLAGFLLMVPDYLIAAFPRRIVNIHPSLLPKYGGKGMWGHHIHEAVAANHERETGITIHYVSPVCDGGEIIAQFPVALAPGDTPDAIAQKVHALEQAHFPAVIASVLKASDGQAQDGD